MADIYVLAVDFPPHPNPRVEAYKYKAGDVLAVLEDGAGPGKAVEICNLYKVVRVPGPASSWKYLLADRPFDSDVDAPRRLKNINITALYAAFEARKSSHPRMGEMASFSAPELRALEITTAPAPGLLVIG